MIESVVIGYLNEKLNVPVYAEEPTRKIDEYVIVQTIDNGRVNFIDACTLSIKSVSTTFENAGKLNKKVKDAMFDIIELSNVSSSKCGGGGQRIDTVTKRYTHECIFNLYYTED